MGLLVPGRAGGVVVRVGEARGVEVLRCGLDCSPEEASAAELWSLRRTRRPGHARGIRGCHKGAPRHGEQEEKDREKEGALVTPEMNLDGVGLWRLWGSCKDGLVAWRGWGWGRMIGEEQGFKKEGSGGL